MLLEHGVKVNSQQTNGVTALMMAAEQVMKNSILVYAVSFSHNCIYEFVGVIEII